MRPEGRRTPTPAKAHVVTHIAMWENSFAKLWRDKKDCSPELAGAGELRAARFCNEGAWFDMKL